MSLFKKNRKILLVSASPRRKSLMQRMDIDFEVNANTAFKEVIPDGMSPHDVPAFLAEGKSKGFYRSLKDGEILVSADTVVICEGKILGKPHHRKTAAEMLHRLSGRTHEVVTAVCVRDKNKCITLSDTASVTFKDLSDKDIEYYVEKYKPVDKAGGYGIQEWIGIVGISRIEGSFYTIMGLPTHLLDQLLKEF